MVLQYGIVGALILGEAAVSANIVSPILIIVVAITAICSFVTPTYEMDFSVRLIRFIYIILAYMGGFLGIGLGIFIQLIAMTSLKSFGVSYLSPYLPVSNYARSKSLVLKPLWQTEKRPSFLNTKRKYAENTITMKWKDKDL